jgi:hypothetical protein
MNWRHFTVLAGLAACAALALQWRTSHFVPHTASDITLTTTAGTIHFPITEIDLGHVNEPTTATFDVINQGNMPVTVGPIHTSCGCLSTHCDPGTIPPGSTGRIVTTVDPRQQPPGRHLKVADVELPGNHPTSVRLSVRFHNRPDVIVPDEVVIRAVEGMPGSVPIDLTDHRERPLHVTQLSCTPSTLSAVILSEPTAYLPGWVYRLEVRCRADAPVGETNGVLEITTDDPARSVIRVRVDARISPRVVASPAILRLEADPVGGRSGRIFVRDSLGKPVEIESVSCDSADTTCTLEPVANPAVRIVTVRHSEPASTTRLTSRVRVVLKRPVRTALHIEVRP